MLKTIQQFLSLVKFSHTIFALPFALIGFFMGMHSLGQALPIKLLLDIVLCMVFARSAAMAFNRYIDRKFDAANPRTSNREIPAGVIRATTALYFVILNALAFVIVTYTINPICFYLSPVALLVILGYSYTKRYTALCHLVLGLGLSLAPVGAYLAVTGQFSWEPICLGVVVLTWVSGFDIIYALQDEGFDKSQQLHSIPAYVGIQKALHISTLLHLASIAFVFYLGTTFHFSWIYWIGAILFSGLLLFQHSLVKPNDLSKVNLAFATTNGIGSVVFAVFVISAILIGN